MSRFGRTARRLVRVAVALGLVWLGGFALFIVSSLAIPPDHAGQTDAIVVLTGGRLRLETGLKLLAAGEGRKLLISGVNPRVDRAELLRALGAAAEREACCIVVGHAADNTYGNA